MVRRGPRGRPPSLPSALPRVNCHAEAIRTAVSSRSPASAWLPASGWLVIDRGGRARGRAHRPGHPVGSACGPGGPTRAFRDVVDLAVALQEKSARGPQGAGKVRATPYPPPSTSPGAHVALRTQFLGNDSDRARCAGWCPGVIGTPRARAGGHGAGGALSQEGAEVVGTQMDLCTRMWTQLSSG